MKVGIVGSRAYQSKSKVRDFIFKCKQEFGDDLVIVSGGQPEGADGFAKKCALELEVKYAEFPPRHYNWNEHCVKPPYEDIVEIVDGKEKKTRVKHYGLPYRVWNFFDRNTEIAEYSEVLICFIPPSITIEQSKGTYDTYKKAKKLNKAVEIIS